MKEKIQVFGRALSGMVVGDHRGGVIGAIATMGVIVGSDIPMFIGAMIMGTLSAGILKKFDKLIEGKIKAGFEMLINNFSLGIIGAILACLSMYLIAPVVTGLNSVFFLLESNPGPGLGILLAYCIAGKGSAKTSAPGAVIIHFLGGIHEIYFPYILMNPLLLIAVIASGASGVFIFSLFGVGLTGIEVDAYAADQIPDDLDLIICQKDLKDLMLSELKADNIYTVDNLLNQSEYETIINQLQ